MKLLVDCHCFDFKMSQGITTYIQGLYTRLPDLCPEIRFYFVAEDIDRIKSIFGKKENIKYIPLTSKNRIYRLFFEIPKIIKDYGIDVAHYQYVSPLVKNCKTIVTLHDILFVDYPQYFPFLYRFSKTLPFKISAKRADLLCTVSRYSKERISKLFKINSESIITTPNAVDEDFYNIEGLKPNEFPEKYILYVSRIEPRKNHKMIIESFDRLGLGKLGYKLVFIGRETVPTPELHSTIDKLSPEVRDKIILISQSPFSELKLWYKYADLFVYPTIAEGFGIPPIEAAAAKVPVVCNNATAMSDFTFFGQNLIDMGNHELLDRAIRRNLANRDEDQLENVSKMVKTKYNWDTIAQDFRKVLLSKFI